jgi:hypothetical protein
LLLSIAHGREVNTTAVEGKSHPKPTPRLRHTLIAAHSHRVDRIATVVSGTWRIGYGDKFDESKLKVLPSGSFYTNRSRERSGSGLLSQA